MSPLYRCCAVTGTPSALQHPIFQIHFQIKLSSHLLPLLSNENKLIAVVSNVLFKKHNHIYQKLAQNIGVAFIMNH